MKWCYNKGKTSQNDKLKEVRIVRDWLKTARNDAGLTMKETAEKLDISESYYCSIENGTRQKRMDISLAMKISEVFALPLKAIFDAEMDVLAGAARAEQ